MENTQSITVMQTGDYWVEVYNEFGCSSSSDIVKINVSLGLDPNSFHVFIPSWKLVKAYDLAGHLIFSKNIFVECLDQNKLLFDQLGKGFFIVNLQDDTHVETYKIINQ
jgi:hypothetical protein